MLVLLKTFYNQDNQFVLTARFQSDPIERRNNNFKFIKMLHSTLPPLPDPPGLMGSNTEKKTEYKKIDITIHVCDEAKKLKKDFTCPRDLLLSEMTYFQDYLTSDSWEDIDISVHCDVKIFYWLMRYVKRNIDKKHTAPTLDIKSAVSILISSDFLKMEKLVEECVQFCHGNLSEIIATPCNMSCINDSLVRRIASTFTQHDLEQVVDKKDKFKSKLFCKKIEELFDPTHSSQHSPNNASTLFKCLHCGKLLLPSFENKVECTVARTIIDRNGNLQYIHSLDDSWDVSGYLLTSKQTAKSWRVVFWRLWSAINCLECSVCEKTFPLHEYNQCRYHPEKATVVINPETSCEKLIHPCCGIQAFLFEPITRNNGCMCRHHEVDFKHARDTEKNSNSVRVFNDLTSVLNLICEKNVARPESSHYNFESMIKTELSRLNHYVSVVSKEDRRDKKRLPLQKSFFNYSGKSIQSSSKPSTKRAASTEEDSDVEEQGIVRIIILHAPPLNKNLTKTWNCDLPVRLNQDMQRECDIKRMNELLMVLKMTHTDPPSAQHLSSVKQEQNNAGIYHHIENKLKAELSQNSLSNIPMTKYSKNK